MNLKINIRTVCSIVLLVTSFFSVKGANSIQFYNLNDEYGISIRETDHVLSDDYGFVWIASKMGIVRYTQDDIRIYQLPYDSENIITVHLLYKNDELYAYTNNGQILKYDPIQDKFAMIINISRLLRNPYIVVSQILVDDQGRMWLASSFGLFSYEKDNGLKSIVQSQDIQYMEWLDTDRFLYVVNGQIKLYNILNDSNSDYYTFPNETNYIVSYLFLDHKLNTLWIGTLADGLFYLKKENGDFQFSQVPQIPNQPILAIEENSDSTIMVGVDGQGVWELNKFDDQILNIYKEDTDDPTSLKGNGVYDIYRDHKNRVWVCTYSGGASFFDQANPYVTQINHVINDSNSLINNDVNSVWEDDYGKIWFATNNGVSCWDISANRWQSFYHNKKEQAQVFLSLYGDDQGRIWAGTYSSGVYVIDCKTGKELAHYSSDETGNSFDCNFVFDIYEDSQSDIWIGGVQSDLICYQVSNKEFISYPDLSAYTIREYKPDKMLLGTTYGLVLLDKLSGNLENLFEGVVIRDFYVDNDLLWICTSGDGLIRYNIRDKKTKRYTIESGLPSNFVNGIVKSDGYLWLGTEAGMCRLNPVNNRIHTFNSILPLSNVSFNNNSHFSLKNGKLIWGTNKGAVMFEPASLQISQPQGQIFYQDLNISGQSIRDSVIYNLEIPLDSLKELSLKYYQNTISLELIPIDVNSSGSKFSWKLEGLDQEWSNPTNNRILSYSNIPSDSYSLRIRMYDGSLNNVIAERSLKLKIIPPFWNTWWFRTLIFLFAGGLALFVLTYYIDRLKKQHSEEKIRFFANTAHDIRTSLTLIKGPVEELNKESGLSNKGLEYLHLATEQTQRLVKVVTQLMDFQKVDVGKERLTLKMTDIVSIIQNRVMMFESFAKTKNIQIKFVSNQAKFVTAVDEGMIEKVVDNLISNAIKYSFPEKPVNVKLECLPTKWMLEVKDHGIGIGKKAQRHLFNEFYRGDNAINSKIVGSGIGLLLVKNYVSLHGGKVNCESQPNIGSAFQVIIPAQTVEKGEVDNTLAEDKVVLQMADVKPTNSQTLNEINASSSHKMKVLIVEDHEYLREFLKSAMESEFTIAIAENGEHAWELLKKDPPDLVVSDIMMPKMDGYELCSKIKTTYETSHIPVILLTALSGKAEQLKGLGLGADDYLMKPFDVTLLQQRFKSVVQNRELVREKALKIIKYSEEDNAILDNELNDQFVKKMIGIVRENIANSNFSKDDFASAMNVSPSLLYKKVKALTNQSPTDFIKSIRLDYALDLIHSKRYTITEISELCGFSSVGYFSTVFRKHYGKSPTQIV